MQHQSNAPGSHAASASIPRKRLGSYLVEAGLVTAAQIDVALHDQRFTEETTGHRMSLGEILSARGWVKEQTIEYLMKKIVIPERSRFQRLNGRVLEPTPINGSSRPRGAVSTSLVRSPDTPTSSIVQAMPISLPDASSPADSSHPGNKAFARREAPIAKPLPSVQSGDGDVNWVG